MNQTDPNPVLLACVAATCTNCHCVVLVDLPVDPVYYDRDVDFCLNCGYCAWEVME